MNFAWAEFLVIAKELLANPPAGSSVEGVQRTVIGRAYYAAFGHARDYAVDYLGFVERGGPEDHGRLRDHLRGRRRQAIAARLNDLRDWRNRADYDADFAAGGDTLEVAATEAVTAADYVIASLPPPAPRP